MKLFFTPQSVKNNGVLWKNYLSKRKFFIERTDIVNWRTRCIAAMKQFREQNKTIFYIDETWINSNIRFRKC